MTAADDAPMELLSITTKPPGKARLTARHVQKVILLNSRTSRTLEHNISYYLIQILLPSH